MEQIQNCIADAHYNEALQDMVNSKPVRRIAQPPADFDMGAYESSLDTSCDAILREPIGFYCFRKFLEEKNQEAKADFLDKVLYNPIQQGDVESALIVFNSYLNPSRIGSYDELIQQIRSALDIGNANNIFENLKNAILENLQSQHDEFKASSHYQRYLKVKWATQKSTTIDDFTQYRDLGRGAFGVVCAVKRNETGEYYAMKCSNRKLVKGKKASKLVMDERNILARLGENTSPFVISLKYAFKDEDTLYMCLELLVGGDLAFHLRRDGTFGVTRTRFYAAEIALGIAHLHSLNIVYRDLKPENVLMENNGHLRISDLGLAYDTRGGDIKGRAGTPGYWPPQMVKKEPYGFDCDWWSLGCVIFEFLYGKCPFHPEMTGLEDRDKGTLEWEVQFPDDPLVPEEAKDLIRKLLIKEREERLGSRAGIEELKVHPFFASIDWEKLARLEVNPPWKPQEGAINAEDISDIESKNQEFEYRKIALTEEDEMPDFPYISMLSHQKSIVQVLEMEDRNELDDVPAYSEGSKGGCCLIL